jgi:hypothetical protein
MTPKLKASQGPSVLWQKISKQSKDFHHLSVDPMHNQKIWSSDKRLQAKLVIFKHTIPDCKTQN